MSYMNSYGPAPHKSFVAQWLEHPTGVPKVIVSIPATSSPGFSLLLRERTLVAVGHVEMCVNKLWSWGRSSSKFCRVDDEILSRVLGRKFLSKNGAGLLSCFRQHYFEGKTVYLFGKFVLYLKKIFSRLPANRIRKILLDLHVQNQLFENLELRK